MAQPKKVDTAQQPAEIPEVIEEAAVTDNVTDLPTAANDAVSGEVRAGRLVPMVLGGAAASLLGFGTAFLLATTYPQALGLADATGIEQRLKEHDKRLTDLTAVLNALPVGMSEAQPAVALRADLDADRAALAQLQQQQDGLARQIAALDERLKAGGSMPGLGGTATADQTSAATDAVVKKAKLAEEEALRLKAEAEKMLRLASLQAALGDLRAAYESGAALDPQLVKLTNAGMTIPDALASQAQGVPTAAALREGFAPAARDALVVSLADSAEGGIWGRIGALLRGQTGARSLTPHAGTDPDAILSRAEAALGAGDLAAARAEIATLPDAGQARMAEWSGLAERRQAAGAAIAALEAEVSALQ